MAGDIAFLLEGAVKSNSYITSTQLKYMVATNAQEVQLSTTELKKAFELASKSKSIVFDSIVSTNAYVFIKYFEALPHQNIANLWIFKYLYDNAQLLHKFIPKLNDLDNTKLFNVYTKGLDIYLNPIKIAYAKVYKTLPNWLKNFNYKNLLAEINSHGGIKHISRICSSPVKINGNLEEDLIEYWTKVSNHISAEATQKFIKDHPKVKAIYSLIGQAHLPFMDEKAQLACSGDFYRFLTISNDEKQAVHLYLFGGGHFTEEASELLEKFYNKQNKANLNGPSTSMEKSCEYVSELVKEVAGKEYEQRYEHDEL